MCPDLINSQEKSFQPCNCITQRRKSLLWNCSQRTGQH